MNKSKIALMAATLTLGWMLPSASVGSAAEINPPAGFTSLFNGQDLTGWWGADTEDPRKWMALSPQEFKKKHDDSLLNIRQHWRAENDELVNDGQGLYLTTEKNYGDFELLVDYRRCPRPTAAFTCAACPQVQIWDYTEEAQVQHRRRQRIRRALEQQPGRARQRSAGAGRQTVRRMESFPHPAWSAIAHHACG